MYHLFEKDGDTHESEAGEKPQKLSGQLGLGRAGQQGWAVKG